MNPMAQAIQDARYSVISHDKAIITTWRVFDGGWYALFPSLSSRLSPYWVWRISEDNRIALRRIYKMGKQKGHLVVADDPNDDVAIKVEGVQ
jgi:hypothetical protein